MLDDLARLPKGSRFYKCAFQVNPFDYVTRHNHQTGFADEDSYNKALIGRYRSVPPRPFSAQSTV